MQEEARLQASAYGSCALKQGAQGCRWLRTGPKQALYCCQPGMQPRKEAHWAQAESPVSVTLIPGRPELCPRGVPTKHKGARPEAGQSCPDMRLLLSKGRQTGLGVESSWVADHQRKVPGRPWGPSEAPSTKPGRHSRHTQTQTHWGGRALALQEANTTWEGGGSRAGQGFLKPLGRCSVRSRWVPRCLESHFLITKGKF